MRKPSKVAKSGRKSARAASPLKAVKNAAKKAVKKVASKSPKKSTKVAPKPKLNAKPTSKKKTVVRARKAAGTKLYDAAAVKKLAKDVERWAKEDLEKSTQKMPLRREQFVTD